MCAALLCARTLPAHAGDNAAQAAARASLMHTLQLPAAPETNAEATSSPVPVQAPAVSAPATPPPARPVAAAPVSESVSAPVLPASAGDNPAQAAARAALRQHMPAGSITSANPAAAITKAPATPSTSASVMAPAQVVRPAAVVHPSIPVPAPPITTAQASRLQELDAKYSADQISPEDYFVQREAILKGQ
ncbi:MAG TPA: hypothetical protein VNX46_09245 [Candidatus Acidoferrum sp.]|nr:hypothetical protein [Candidatus Acidoferrum sp.]